MARMLLIMVGLVAASLAGRAMAQTPPDATELAAYRGLHAAAASGDVAAIRRLARAGEKLDARDGNGRTPLHVAAFRGQVDAIRTLIGAGADPGLFDNQRYDAVTIVAVSDDVPALKALLAAGASAKLTTSRYDGTALIAAAHLGRDGIVRELIVAGAPLDHVNNLGWTALIEAVILGDGGKRHVETVRALLAAGANRNLADRQAVTPLQHARARGYGAMVAVLKAGSSR
ncbi:ankyrin repeat domain-containing protein [Bosea sp. ASV33]|uniref:ankyrin repeat domain-containing protein n=1 Tax=Bosea sp. ASV33 TaxID=2795106 RepID=UPI0018EE36AA|nr:ankyrin repeat domain-containing protein [Bosea sp. ASV33]